MKMLNIFIKCLWATSKKQQEQFMNISNISPKIHEAQNEDFKKLIKLYVIINPFEIQNLKEHEF